MTDTPPADAIPVLEAAALVDRSLSSVRAYVRGGHIRGYRPAGASASNAPLLVSRSELMAYVASAGLSPAPARRPSPDKPPPSTDAPDVVALLRADVRAAELQADARVAMARLEALERTLEAKDGAIAALQAVADTERRRADELRDRLTAAEAELAALRSYAGLPWYHRLLTGPKPPAMLTGTASGRDD